MPSGSGNGKIYFTGLYRPLPLQQSGGRQGEFHLETVPRSVPGVFYNDSGTVGGIFTDACAPFEKAEQKPPN